MFQFFSKLSVLLSLLFLSAAQEFQIHLDENGKPMACDWSSKCPEGMTCDIRDDIEGRFVCYRPAPPPPPPPPPPERPPEPPKEQPPPPPAPPAKVIKQDILFDSPSDENRIDDLGPREVPFSPTDNQMQALNDLQCPPADDVARCQDCGTVEDCPRGMVCCPNGGGRSCTFPTGSPESQPQVMPIVTGFIKSISNSDPLVIDQIGTVTLIKTQGRYLMVDTGTQSVEDNIFNALSIQGIAPEDIDAVVITHGHPDHFLTASTFTKAIMIYGNFKIRGSVFVATPLAQSSSSNIYRLCVQNVYVISTPGHTPQDVSVIAENVPNKGTVAIVGDVFLSSNDEGLWSANAWNATMQEQSRKTVVCLADYIVPGHGPMFAVDQLMKDHHRC